MKTTAHWPVLTRLMPTHDHGNFTYIYKFNILGMFINVHVYFGQSNLFSIMQSSKLTVNVISQFI